MEHPLELLTIRQCDLFAIFCALLTVFELSLPSTLTILDGADLLPLTVPLTENEGPEIEHLLERYQSYALDPREKGYESTSVGFGQLFQLLPPHPLRFSSFA